MNSVTIRVRDALYMYVYGCMVSSALELLLLLVRYYFAYIIQCTCLVNCKRKTRSLNQTGNSDRLFAIGDPFAKLAK